MGPHQKLAKLHADHSSFKRYQDPAQRIGRHYSMARRFAEQVFGKKKAHTLHHQLMNGKEISCQVESNKQKSGKTIVTVWWNGKNMVDVDGHDSIDLIEARDWATGWVYGDEFMWMTLAAIADPECLGAKGAKEASCLSLFPAKTLSGLVQPGQELYTGLEERIW